MSTEATDAEPRLTTREALLGYERTLDCVHCGLCLQACPTYRLWGQEADSPRGRIVIMRAIAEGRIEPTDTARRHLDLCLGCRACETVCPAGVRYGEMLELVRHETARSPREPFALRALVAHPRRLRAAFGALRLAQRTGLVSLGRALGLPRRLFGRAIGELERDLPPIAPGAARARLPRLTPAAGTKRGTVAILEGCVATQLFGGVNRATARVLSRVGFDVATPERHACCGALHLHQGFLEHGRDLARHTIERFEKTGADLYVVNSAGCGSAMKEYAHLLADDAAWAARAEAFSKRVRDVSELLASIELPPMPHRVERRVTYHDACHLVHGQKIARQPRELLRRIPGLELVPLRDADQCCGSAGVYNVVEYDASMQVLEQKMDRIAETGADVVAAGNPGCLLQIAVGARRRGRALEVVHPIELLDRALHG
jgi:glycolate dehydrogenase iron-sulfur subunit